MDKTISTLCEDFLDKQILEIDFKKNKLPLDLSELHKLMKSNWESIKYRLIQNWR